MSLETLEETELTMSNDNIHEEIKVEIELTVNNISPIRELHPVYILQ